MYALDWWDNKSSQNMLIDSWQIENFFNFTLSVIDEKINAFFVYLSISLFSKMNEKSSSWRSWVRIMLTHLSKSATYYNSANKIETSLSDLSCFWESNITWMKSDSFKFLNVAIELGTAKDDLAPSLRCS